MRRSNPGLDPVAALSAWSDTTATHTDPWTHYACKLVTPLYGGGVREAKVDTGMPIRAAGIRGQLRFWWRIACCAPDEPSQSMFQREAAIWGGIASTGPTASQVAVRVERVSGVKVEPAFVYQANRNRPGELRTMPEAADWVEPYALFPARGELTQDKRDVAVTPHRLALAGVGFQLGIKFGPKLSQAQREEVATALRWWASFGGVGARTRRGLGAVRVDGLDPVTAEEVRAKGGQLRLRPATKAADAAWKASLARLRDFRQAVNVGRNPPSDEPNRPGRSRWPEPDTIRLLTGHHAHGHAPTHPVTNAYPRAAFGLPIVFHFKDENKGEPPQQLLVPEGGDRMASPLILRPYWSGQAWHPAVLCLPGWAARLSTPVGFGNGPFHCAWPTDPAERARLAAQIKPMDGRGDDPLTAFMDYFEQD
ncbi:type III-B CRISPR module RAMP protein Cmr1 [Thiocapsa imhoffii]|uniref:Type III-B CRISPR module RAMP protein Cmr1 n=1 Tax=Thiocapsa imhoffii TaxID=382777 RepID=A0A9X0WIM6_9GAMM|nr:type III-B CRISPR module RAMP protein Cmr1 [Thiocapsa imhoffii]MBK1645221.1 type III-B CRISPR module RAMP protein Cmr1 [Thiocapsa imhoffii]